MISRLIRLGVLAVVVGYCGSAKAEETPPSNETAKDLVGLVKIVEPAVVGIRNRAGTGSGVIIDGRGWVITNYHVAGGEKSASLMITRSNGTTAPAQLLESDRERDVVLLQTPPIEENVALKLALKDPEKGESVATFGSPHGFEFSTSQGVLAAIRTGSQVAKIAPGAYRGLGYTYDAKWLQHTAAMSPGNSGGPLVNMKGEILGLNTWSDVGGQNLNFAISSEHILKVVDRMVARSAPPPTDLGTWQKIPKRAKRDPGPGAPKGGKEPAKEGPEVAYFTDKFPSGRTFIPTVFDVEENIIEETRSSSRRASSDQRPPVIFKHPNGVMYAVVQQVKGKMDGTTLANYDNQNPMVFAMYSKGKRHGVLKTFGEDGKKVLFSQYAFGKRDGFTVFFNDGHLALLIEYQKGEMNCIRVLDDVVVKAQYDSVDELRNRDLEGGRLLDSLAKTDEMLEANERKFQKAVREADHQISLAEKKEKNAARRARELERSVQIQNDYNNFARRTLGRMLAGQQ